MYYVSNTIEKAMWLPFFYESSALKTASAHRSTEALTKPKNEDITPFKANLELHSP